MVGDSVTLFFEDGGYVNTDFVSEVLSWVRDRNIEKVEVRLSDGRRFGFIPIVE